MKLRSFSRFFKEAFQSIGRNIGMSIATIATIALTLFVCGVFALLVLNANGLATQIESTVEIQAYMPTEVSPSEAAEAKAAIQELSAVETVTFVSKEEGLEQMAKRMGMTAQELLDDMGGENPLPDSYLIQVTTADDVIPTAKALESIHNIEKVQYGQGTVEKLFQVLKWVRYFGVGIIIFLIVASIFLIAFNIKLTVANRKWEIIIMRYVGASNWYIRGPFCIAGMIMGLIGAIIACGALYGCYELVLQSVGDTFSFFSLLQPDITFLYMYLGILVIGLLLGALGSIVSLNVYLREKCS